MLQYAYCNKIWYCVLQHAYCDKKLETLSPNEQIWSNTFHCTLVSETDQNRIHSHEPDPPPKRERERERVYHRNHGLFWPWPLASYMPHPHMFRLDKLVWDILGNAVCAWFGQNLWKPAKKEPFTTSRGQNEIGPQTCNNKPGKRRRRIWLIGR